MSSTNSPDERIRLMFDALMKEARSGKVYFQTQPDSKVESYYETPQHERYAYFCFIDTTNEASLLKELETLWTENKELLPLAPEMSKLAFELRETQGEQSTDLSPFVYTLY